MDFIIFRKGSEIPELENRITDYDIIKQVKSNCYVTANFSSIFSNPEFLVKIKLPSYVTRKFYLYLKLKFSRYVTWEFMFH